MLEARGLETFYGGAQILNGVSVHAGRGEVVALLGRNGAGKTTTMKSIMGLVVPRKGSVRFSGQDITGWPPFRINRLGLGYVPEDRRIFKDLTVLENLEVGRQPSAGDGPVWTPERLFELFPNLRDRQDNLGSQLSGGEQQMLTIARTLMGNPSAILLDEPSEGIAPVIVAQLAETVRELKREGLAILLSEQSLHFARAVSDRADIIEKGQIRYSGSFAELDEQPEILRKYLAV